MELSVLKEEYKKETSHIQAVKQLPMEDLDQMFEEIDEASTLNDFVKVVSLWSQESVEIGAAMVILKRIINLHEQ